MLPSVRFVRWTVLASAFVAIVVSVVLAGRSPSSPQSLSALLGGELSDTPWGRLGPADRDLLIKIRQADLFGGPVGEQAQERAAAVSVRRVAGRLAAAHARLDARLLAAAAKLGLTLPSQPSDQQRVWLGAISLARPAGYDRTFVNLLRAAYGELLPLVEGVRSGTENQLVRELAIAAGDTIEDNMRSLEGTGLVDYTLLPASTAPATRLTAIGDYAVPSTVLLFVAAVLVGAALLRGLAGPPRSAPGPGWLAEALGRACRSGRRASGHRAGSGGAPAERMVTTAELIAVLNPRTELTGTRLVDRPTSRAVVLRQPSGIFRS